MKKQDLYIELNERKSKSQVKRKYLKWELKHLKSNWNKHRNPWWQMKLIQQTIPQKLNKKVLYLLFRGLSLKSFEEERVLLLPKFCIQLESKSSLNPHIQEIIIQNSWIVLQATVFAIKIRILKLIALHPVIVRFVNGNHFEMSS